MRRPAGNGARGGPSAGRRLLRQRLALAGLVTLVLAVLVALAAPLLPLDDPHATDLAARLARPLSDGHLLGTDHLGRDILSRLVHGLGLSLVVALLGTTVAAGAGTVIGIVAGYHGGRVDAVLMRGIDVLMAFPYLLLALAIVAALGPGLENAALAIAVVNVPFFARTVRGTVLGLRHEDFIGAARLSGLSDARILTAELLPNVLPVILVAMTTSLGWMVLETAGLSFLGLGAQPPRADLGGMLGQGRHLLATAPHVSVIPGTVILLLVVATNLVGDGLRDVLDPRMPATPPGGRGRARAAAARAPAAETPALLAVDGLGVRFGEGPAATDAVAGVSFRLGAGESVGLVGESGSGKTVTAQALLGLLPPGAAVRGSARWRGEELLARSPRGMAALRGRQLAWVPQDPMTSLHPLITVGRQITECLEGHGRRDRARARRRALEVLGQVRLPDPERALSARPHEMSGGMRQRVAIAIALANRPHLVVADEPTTALDVTTQAQILDLLAGLCRENGTALLFITHDLGIVSRLCDRVLVMQDGRLVESAPTADVLERPKHVYTQRLVSLVPRLGEPGRVLRALRAEDA